MATLTVYQSAPAGTTLTYASAAVGGDQFQNNGKTVLLVRNASVGALTVTVASQYVARTGSASANVAKSVGAGADVVMGPFDISVFNDTGGNVQVTYSGVTTLTVCPVSE